jgi:hypothetical protein
MRSEDDLLKDSDANFVAHTSADNVMNMLMGRILRTDLVEVPVFPTEFEFSVPQAVTPFGIHVPKGSHIEPRQWLKLENDFLASITQEIDFGMRHPTRT